MMNVAVDAGMATQISAFVLLGTWALKKWVLPKMDATMIACIGGALSTIASAFMDPADNALLTSAASGVVGTATAGLLYDKVTNPVLGPLWAKLQSMFPKSKG